MFGMKDFKALKISLASPDQIRSWSHGEVIKPETINYRTLKPEKDGLFCERIFGPTKDFECYCGKYKRVRYKGIVCDKCGVEVTYARVRRERMGHISLASPVAHVWLVRGAPSKMGLLLDISPRNLESINYFAAFIVIAIAEPKRDTFVGLLENSMQEEKTELINEKEAKIKEIEKTYKTRIAELKKKMKKVNQEELELKLQELDYQLKKEKSYLFEETAKKIKSTEEEIGSVVSLAKNIKELDVLDEREVNDLAEFGNLDFLELGTGAEALLEIIKKIDLDKLSHDLRKSLKSASTQKKVKTFKRLKVIDGLRKAKIDPSWMILSVLPVIPPDLRPMVQLSGGRFATSDLNDLYRRVINRNNRLKHLLNLGAPEIILRNEKRMLQEAVDALIDSSPRERGLAQRRGRLKLRSLSDMLRGKQGRFRQNLLGKRVDYSGRSVIVAGPDLNFDECGLPKGMALELFKPFVLREIIGQGLAPNMKSAKHVLERQQAEVWDILEKITLKYPVLLNRAPTLHRLGIQAFYPVLIEGDAIRLHPCVCNAFNADFDGDQMAVHVPLSQKAVLEAKQIMLSPFNILKPSDGDPIVNFKNELGVGIYYLTAENPHEKGSGKFFASEKEAILAWQLKFVHLQAAIKVQIGKEIMETTLGRILFNEVLPPKLRFVNAPVDKPLIQILLRQAFDLYGIEKTVEFIDNIKNLGRHFSTLAGASFSIFDFATPPERESFISQANEELEIIEKDYRRGLTTTRERRTQIIELWGGVTKKVSQKAQEKIDPFSIINMIIKSKASRATSDTIRQLAAMRGTMTDSFGRIIETPIKTNIIEGSSTFDGFISNRAARKGLIDTALMTAEAGYLTRRLVDVAHDLIVRGEDCKTKKGILIEAEEMIAGKIAGRFAAEKIVNPKSKKVLVKSGEGIDDEKAHKIEKLGITKVMVRSAITCENTFGVCIKCYGRNLANQKTVGEGETVGVIAAQSIGEPGTQLTLRTFHKGGIASSDITMGLPRVEELFEARSPKEPAILSLSEGTVEIVEHEDERKIKVMSREMVPIVYPLEKGDKVQVKRGQMVGKGEVLLLKGKKKKVTADKDGLVNVLKDKLVIEAQEVREQEYLINPLTHLNCKSGDKVTIGQQLTEGHLDLREILETRGIEAVQRYLIDEVQKVYQSQGIKINDKHIEVIIRKMFDKARIKTAGDTNLLPQEIVSMKAFQQENSRVLAEGGEVATAEMIILGITRSALYTDSFLSAASFQETTNVLTEAAILGKTDELLGLKENVIIGRLIPTNPKERSAES